MRQLKPVLIVIALAMALLASGSAFADRYSGSGGHKGGYYRDGGHYGGYYGSYYRGGTSLAIGWPYWGPSWYYPSYYYPYYAPVDEVPSTPPVYIERSEPADDSTPSGIWYYCPDSKTYYPYVMECPGSWQTVPAQPSPESRR